MKELNLAADKTTADIGLAYGGCNEINLLSRSLSTAYPAYE